MNIYIDTEHNNDNELFYEIGDWANVLPLEELVPNFSKLPKPGKDVIIAAVIGYTMQDIYGKDDEADVTNIRERFNHLVK